MDAGLLRVVADDLTGACDIAAALLPWPGGILVEAFPTADSVPPFRLRVQNTQSRTMTESAARAAVAHVLDGLAAQAIVLKKIDTALRGHLGAEPDAAIAAAGAAEAFVLPAIPRVGRTTVGGEQRIDGVPVHRTTFAHDPLHPIRDSSVAAHLARGCGRSVAGVSLDEVRASGGCDGAIERGRAAGCTVFVCDAETDDDLGRAVDALLRRPRPLVVAGSLGLGAALRRRLPVSGAGPQDTARARTRAGRLIVVGSTHPMARQQARVIAAAAPVYEVDEAALAEEIAARTEPALRGGGTVVLATPPRMASGTERALLAAMGRVAAACLRRHAPGVLAIVGGETAFGVLRAAGQPWIHVESTPAPLVATGTLVGGALDGVVLVTKGGSSGVPETLRDAVDAATNTGGA
jgi:uncharacterized protein YgbK (DUF1537 family)